MLSLSWFPRSSLFSLLILISLSQRLGAVTPKCHPDDEAGLLAFKSGITSDPSNKLVSWKPGTECCSWVGISCGKNKRVIHISFYGDLGDPNNSLSGTISPSLSKLHFLSNIYLVDLQNLSGTFPDVLFSLPKIQYVHIENSKLSGRIPESIGRLRQMETLSFQGNRFSGQIPSSIGELTRLTQLRLGGNLFSGKVPDTFRRLDKLMLLTLDQNKLSGEIPDFFSSFPQLSTLNLSYNQFTGKIPASFSAMAPMIRFLDLGHNALEGQIPDFLGSFSEINTLDLSWNRFSGTVPKSFANLTMMYNLALSHNLLVDPFPALSVVGIDRLDLSYNNFRLGKIPRWVTKSPVKYSLRLAKCGIKMKLEDWKPEFTDFFDYIDLSDNEITGSPVTLLSMKSWYFRGFYASGNKLEFNLESLRIPETLTELDLSRNLVFGKVPDAVLGLKKLNVSHNRLCGQLPKNNFPASAFADNSCLCGSPLPACKTS